MKKILQDRVDKLTESRDQFKKYVEGFYINSL